MLIERLEEMLEKEKDAKVDSKQEIERLELQIEKLEKQLQITVEKG